MRFEKDIVLMQPASWLALLVCLLFFAAGISSVSQAATQQDWYTCGGANVPGNQRIQSCTRIINQGSSINKASLALAYYNRGLGYFTLKNYQQALSDYTTSIRHNPNYINAYLSRAYIYQGLYQYNKAIDNYNIAVRLAPNNIQALRGRGNSYLGTYQYDKAIADYSRVIRLNPNDLLAYIGRANSYNFLRQYRKAIVDYSVIIRLQPNAVNYGARGTAYYSIQEYGKALADYNKVIQLNSSYAEGYAARGNVYVALKRFDEALVDFNKSLQLSSNNAFAYYGRATAYYSKGQYDKAISDYSDVIRLNSNFPEAFNGRAYTYYKQGKLSLALTDVNKALALKRDSGAIYETRGRIYEAMKDYDLAKKDFSTSLALVQDNEGEVKREAQSGLDRIARLTGSDKQQVLITQAVPERPRKQFKLGHRIALIIGNSNYSHADKLVNPANDAYAIAASLRRLGFAKVIVHTDLDLVGLTNALKVFGTEAISADWAMIYYAGHGVQVDGKNYIIPTDAKLVHAGHVEDEAIPLDRLLSKVSEAKKLRLVILDACRNNPFRSRMIRLGSRTRSLGRGLAPIEPDRGTLVAFAARDGQEALDGSGANSPYTKALLKFLEKPGLEINLLFRKVRDEVIRETKRQEPYVYGSLPGEELYFK